MSAPDLVPIAACPLCRSRERLPLLAEGEPIEVVRCRGCGLVYASAVHDADFLGEDYYGARARQETQDPDLSGGRPGVDRKRRDLARYDQLTGGALLRPRRGARALDLGCHTGLLLDALREAGYRTVGVERSPAAEHARAAGHEVHHLDIETSPPDLEAPFDVITMTHVLEHLLDPLAAIEWASRQLSDRGVLIVEVPNWGDLMRPLWGARYRPLELGDHVSFFERRTLTLAAQQANLAVRTLWSAPTASGLLFPSILTSVDLARAARQEDDGVELPHSVARRPDSAGGLISQLRGPLTKGVLRALDALDPWLERAASAESTWGANIIAVLERPA
ncbi:MAG: class I SAM-dependent methyltransferase [Nannocystaceae bacterium]